MEKHKPCIISNMRPTLGRGEVQVCIMFKQSQTNTSGQNNLNLFFTRLCHIFRRLVKRNLAMRNRNNDPDWTGANSESVFIIGVEAFLNNNNGDAF